MLTAIRADAHCSTLPVLKGYVYKLLGLTAGQLLEAMPSQELTNSPVDARRLNEEGARHMGVSVVLHHPSKAKVGADASVENLFVKCVVLKSTRVSIDSESFGQLK